MKPCFLQHSLVFEKSALMRMFWKRLKYKHTLYTVFEEPDPLQPSHRACGCPIDSQGRHPSLLLFELLFFFIKMFLTSLTLFSHLGSLLCSHPHRLAIRCQGLGVGRGALYQGRNFLCSNRAGLRAGFLHLKRIPSPMDMFSSWPASQRLLAIYAVTLSWSVHLFMVGKWRQHLLCTCFTFLPFSSLG